VQLTLAICHPEGKKAAHSQSPLHYKRSKQSCK
jgi:hypothetical protein